MNHVKALMVGLCLSVCVLVVGSIVFYDAPTASKDGSGLTQNVDTIQESSKVPELSYVYFQVQPGDTLLATRESTQTRYAFPPGSLIGIQSRYVLTDTTAGE
jgi:hypothetical protein